MSIVVNNLDRLCLHTITTKPWTIETAAKKYSAAGIKGISVWRDAIEGKDPVMVKKILDDEGLEVVSLVRGGFFPDTDAKKRKESLDENKRIMEEAAALGAPHVVLVCGAHPDQTLVESRKQILDGISALVPASEEMRVKLGIEPLHPMYADTRSAVNTIKSANDIAEQTGSDQVGVVVDIYHLWWDPDLEKEIQRTADLNKLMAFHICDWNVPTSDFLLDREIMGKGCINVTEIRQWVEKAGFNGFNEVEIFSTKYWETDQDAYLAEIIEGYKFHS